MAPKTYTLDELAVLAAVKARTVRYYIQIGLLDRPEGETRAAKYGKHHLEQLLEIRKYQEGGLLLDQIRELKEGGAKHLQAIRPKYAGSVEVWSRVTLADGVELSIEPGRAGLSPEQVRALIKQTLHVMEQLQKEKDK
jgi:DNA-binding transcriptional MerR regulator